MLQCTIGLRCAAAIAAVVLALPASAEPSSAPDPAHALEGSALVAALRAGNLTLYFRHTATDFSQNDRAMSAYDECATQRNLSEAGREQARRIGAAIRALELPVGEVVASPFCRTMETGRLMFGRAEPSTVVRGYEGTNVANADYTRLIALLASPPQPGTLRMITSHGNPFRAIAGPPHLQEGEAAVLRGNGKAVRGGGAHRARRLARARGGCYALEESPPAARADPPQCEAQPASPGARRQANPCSPENSPPACTDCNSPARASRRSSPAAASPRTIETAAPSTPPRIAMRGLPSISIAPETSW